MSMPATPPIKSHLRLLRPAVIEIRYGQKDKFMRDARFYRRTLGIKKPLPSAASDTVYSFPIGMIPTGRTTQDMEFRLVLQNKNPTGKKRTIIYWEVSNNNPLKAQDSLKAAIDTLTKTNVRPQYTLAEKDSAMLFTNGYYQRALLADGNANAENLVGLVVNPPYPRFAPYSQPAPTSTSLPPGHPTAADTTLHSSKNPTSPYPPAQSQFTVLSVGLGIAIGVFLALAGILVWRAVR